MLDLCHRRLAKRDALLIDLVAEMNNRVETFPGHAASPGQHGVGIVEQCAIPMLLENAPAAFDGIVLAVIGRVVEQLNRLAAGIAKLDHASQKLGSHTTTLGSVIDFELDEFALLLLGSG